MLQVCTAFSVPNVKSLLLKVSSLVPRLSGASFTPRVAKVLGGYIADGIAARFKKLWEQAEACQDRLRQILCAAEAEDGLAHVTRWLRWERIAGGAPCR